MRFFLIFIFLTNTPLLYSFELGRKSIPNQDAQLVVETYSRFETEASHQSLNKEKRNKHNERSLLSQQVNRMMDLKVTIDGLQEQNSTIGKYDLKFFDARMPEHNHGMIVSPKIRKIDNYHWKIEGVKLHMKGLWQFQMKLLVGDQEEQVELNLDINV